MIWICLEGFLEIPEDGMIGPSSRFLRCLAASNRNFDIGRREKAQATKRVRIGGLIRRIPAEDNDRAEGISESTGVRKAPLGGQMWANYLRKLADRIKAILATPRRNGK